MNSDAAASKPLFSKLYKLPSFKGLSAKLKEQRLRKSRGTAAEEGNALPEGEENDQVADLQSEQPTIAEEQPEEGELSQAARSPRSPVRTDKAQTPNSARDGRSPRSPIRTSNFRDTAAEEELLIPASYPRVPKSPSQSPAVAATTSVATPASPAQEQQQPSSFGPLGSGCMESLYQAKEQARVAEARVRELEGTVQMLTDQHTELHATWHQSQELVARQHEREVESLKLVIDQQRQRLYDLEKEDYDLKSILQWGRTDSQPPSFVRWRDYEALQLKLQEALSGSAKREASSGPSAYWGAAAHRQALQTRARLMQAYRAIDVLLLVTATVQRSSELRTSCSASSRSNSTAASVAGAEASSGRQSQRQRGGVLARHAEGEKEDDEQQLSLASPAAAVAEASPTSARGGTAGVERNRPPALLAAGVLCSPAAAGSSAATGASLAAATGSPSVAAALSSATPQHSATSYGSEPLPEGGGGRAAATVGVASGGGAAGSSTAASPEGMVAALRSQLAAVRSENRRLRQLARVHSDSHSPLASYSHGSKRAASEPMTGAGGGCLTPSAVGRPTQRAKHAQQEGASASQHEPSRWSWSVGDTGRPVASLSSRMSALSLAGASPRLAGAPGSAAGSSAAAATAPQSDGVRRSALASPTKGVGGASTGAGADEAAAVPSRTAAMAAAIEAAGAEVPFPPFSMHQGRFVAYEPPPMPKNASAATSPDRDPQLAGLASNSAATPAGGRGTATAMGGLGIGVVAGTGAAAAAVPSGLLFGWGAAPSAVAGGGGGGGAWSAASAAVGAAAGAALASMAALGGGARGSSSSGGKGRAPGSVVVPPLVTPRTAEVLEELTCCVSPTVGRGTEGMENNQFSYLTSMAEQQQQQQQAYEQQQQHAPQRQPSPRALLAHDNSTATGESVLIASVALRGDGDARQLSTAGSASGLQLPLSPPAAFPPAGSVDGSWGAVAGFATVAAAAARSPSSALSPAGAQPSAGSRGTDSTTPARYSNQGEDSEGLVSSGSSPNQDSPAHDDSSSPGASSGSSPCVSASSIPAAPVSPLAAAFNPRSSNDSVTQQQQGRPSATAAAGESQPTRSSSVDTGLGATPSADSLCGSGGGGGGGGSLGASCESGYSVRMGADTQDSSPSSEANGAVGFEKSPRQQQGSGSSSAAANERGSGGGRCSGAGSAGTAGGSESEGEEKWEDAQSVRTLRSSLTSTSSFLSALGGLSNPSSADATPVAAAALPAAFAQGPVAGGEGCVGTGGPADGGARVGRLGEAVADDEAVQAAHKWQQEEGAAVARTAATGAAVTAAVGLPNSLESPPPTCSRSERHESGEEAAAGQHSALEDSGNAADVAAAVAAAALPESLDSPAASEATAGASIGTEAAAAVEEEGGDEITSSSAAQAAIPRSATGYFSLVVGNDEASDSQEEEEDGNDEEGGSGICEQQGRQQDAEEEQEEEWRQQQEQTSEQPAAAAASDMDEEDDSGDEEEAEGNGTEEEEQEAVPANRFATLGLPDSLGPSPAASSGCADEEGEEAVPTNRFAALGLPDSLGPSPAASSSATGEQEEEEAAGSQLEGCSHSEAVPGSGSTGEEEEDANDDNGPEEEEEGRPVGRGAVLRSETGFFSVATELAAAEEEEGSGQADSDDADADDEGSGEEESGDDEEGSGEEESPAVLNRFAALGLESGAEEEGSDVEDESDDDAMEESEEEERNIG